MTPKPETTDARVLALCGGMVVAGGAERMVFDVLGTLRERGAVVHCVLNNWAFERIAALADEIGASWSQSSYSVRLDRHARRIGAYLEQVRDVLRTHWDVWHVARAFKPTHVLVADHETVLRSWLTLVLLRLSGVRVVMKLCNAPVQTEFYRRLWRWAVNPAVSEFVANSRFTLDALTALGMPERKTSLVFETLPRRSSRRLPGPRDPRKVIYVGQIIPEKGLQVLLDAIGLLAAAGRNVHLDVVGDMDGWISPKYGNYRQRLRIRAAAPDLAARVSFLGLCEDVPALMAESAVHCCPSLPQIRESFGLVVLEAKAAGTPSVVFRCGALVEQVTSGTDGIICAEPTPKALADSLDVFLSDPARAAAAGQAASQSVSRFGRDVFTRRWLQTMAPGRGRERARGRGPDIAVGVDEALR